jgi:4-diphosphocytidyl-2-C-methyl-D-erythritol kinase
VSEALVAPAKINLTLEVVARLPSGYHAIRSVMIALPRLCDSIVVDVRPGPTRIGIECSAADVPVDERNLCHRIAARFLQQAQLDAHVAIRIDKRIPRAAGLGGGSSDAASVLLALDRHFGHPLPPQRLAELALDVGRDIPFFLARADAALVTGTGEEVRPFDPAMYVHALLVNPRVEVSTGDAYRALSAELWYMTHADRADRSAAMTEALKSGRLNAACAALHNDFELVVAREHAIVPELLQALRAFGAHGASMSGSGSTVFGLFADEARLERARRALAAHYPAFFIARGA